MSDHTAGEYTSSVERLRAEYVEMREQHFGFSDLYAAEWDRILATHDATVEARVRETIAAEIEARHPEMGRSINITAYRDGKNDGMTIAASIARGDA